MSDTFFSTPAGLKDYCNDKHYQSWSTYISVETTRTVEIEEDTVGSGNSQFYNPETKPAAIDKKTTVVSWNGFPRRLTIEYPKDYLEVADRKDGWPYNGDKYKVARNQDEYLEWFVYKNDDGKITRIDFTCEGPEYWDTLFEWEPNTCLELYQKYISKDVKLKDLYTVDKGRKNYNPYNKWNTTEGCMHLNCPPNSLGAEIQLAGDASIIRMSNGNIVTNAQKLINCSQYGRADRNSDPHIGSACNELCRHGKRITVGDPVCLFIASVKTAGWTTPNKKDASQYMQLLRGTKEQGLRYSLNVPESEGFTVGDIEIAGEQIQYGGTVAFLMDMGLTAEFCTNENGAQPAYGCIGPTSQPKAWTLFKEMAQPCNKEKAHYGHRALNAKFAPCK